MPKLRWEPSKKRQLTKLIIYDVKPFIIPSPLHDLDLRKNSLAIMHPFVSNLNFITTNL